MGSFGSLSLLAEGPHENDVPLWETMSTCLEEVET